MTARVLDLNPRLPQPCDCSTHRLASLAARLRESRDQHAAELLVPMTTFGATLDDALTVLDRIVSEHNPTHERTNP